MIPKDPNYQNPYKYDSKTPYDANNNDANRPITTMTKKPRRKLQRGPRLSGGEL